MDKTANKSLVKKANESIAIRATSGKITFLVRKIFNVLLHEAQLQKGLGESDIFKIPLSRLITELNYNSNDVDLVKDYCRQMMSIRVEWNSNEKSWESAVLLASAKIEFDGQNSVIEWGYAPHLRARLMDPKLFTPLSIRLQNRFSTHAALALYECCERYKTSPGGLTNREAPEWWYLVLTGNSDAAKRPVYKYWKRDHITPAVREINTVTDIEVELIEHKAGAKVIALQFAIKLKQQETLDLPGTPLINTALLGRLIAFGMSKTEAEDYAGQVPETQLLAVVELVEQRLSKKDLPLLNSPVAFFKTALRQGWKPAPVQKKQIKNEAPAMQALPDSERVEAIKRVRERYMKLPGNDQIALLAEYESEIEFQGGNEYVLGLLRKKGLAAKQVEAHFMGWLVGRLAG